LPRAIDRLQSQAAGIQQQIEGAHEEIAAIQGVMKAKLAGTRS
jgi:hypothetical protein